jgi:preprotein translocase subunit SecG
MASGIVLGSFLHYLLGLGMSFTAIVLIIIVLVQRGRGGGLSGALGGMGGQSAFGTKAGDAFTRLTIGIAIFWGLLCIVSVKLLGPSTGAFGTSSEASAPREGMSPATGPSSDPAGQTDATSPSGTTDIPAGGGSPPGAPSDSSTDQGKSD